MANEYILERLQAVSKGTAAGKNNRQIAAELGISEKAVRDAKKLLELPHNFRRRLATESVRNVLRAYEKYLDRQRGLLRLKQFRDNKEAAEGLANELVAVIEYFDFYPTAVVPAVQEARELSFFAGDFDHESALLSMGPREIISSKRPKRALPEDSFEQLNFLIDWLISVANAWEPRRNRRYSAFAVLEELVRKESRFWTPKHNPIGQDQAPSASSSAPISAATQGPASLARLLMPRQGMSKAL